MRIGMAFIISPFIGLVVLYLIVSIGIILELGSHGISMILPILQSSIILLLPVYILTLIISLPVFFLVKYISGWTLKSSVVAALATILCQAVIVVSFGDIDNEILQSGKFFIGLILATILYGILFYFIVTPKRNK